jgi:hypothetical protein
MRALFLIPFALLFLFSCSLEKRHYRSGYAIQWSRKSHIPEKNDIPVHTIEPQYPLSASLNDHTPVIVSEEVNVQVSEVECDTIFLKGGARIIARDIQVKEMDLEYKSCDGRNGERLSVAKNEVDNVHHANGGRDYFYSAAPSNTGPELGRNRGYGNPVKPPAYGKGSGANTAEAEKYADKSLWLGIGSALAPFYFLSMIVAGIAIRNGNKAMELLKGSNFNARIYRRARNGLLWAKIGLGIRAAILILIIAVLVLGI